MNFKIIKAEKLFRAVVKGVNIFKEVITLQESNLMPISLHHLILARIFFPLKKSIEFYLFADLKCRY